MRGLKQAIAILLAAILAFGLPVSAFANEIGKEDVTVISNSFVKVTVNNHTGRFAIRTVDGQPVRKNDQNVNMMFRGDDPETSFTTFRIDGTDYIFGNPYKFGADFFSEITPPRIVDNSDGTKQVETTWSIKGVQITQVLKLYTNTSDKMNAGNVNVGYIVNNPTGADVQVGSRILLDTMLGSNDGPAFQVGTAYKAPLQVERRLVDEDKLPSTISPEEKPLYTLPGYWVMKDKYDSSNPLATHVMAYGFNNFSENDINIVDEMVVGHWARMANTKWDYEVNPNLDFTTDTNDFGSADSAVALYWNPDRIPAGTARSFETVYGLGEIIQPDKVFSIRYIDPVNQLATLDDNSGYENEGVFDITAEVENLASYNMEQSSIRVSLQLDNALKFVELDDKGKIVRGTDGKVKTLPGNTQNAIFNKEATPAEAELGIQPKFKPGETVTASFKVLGKGRPWPTTPEYMLTVTSPETEKQIAGVEDEAVKAQYKSSKANFVFLPPVGVAAQTFVYAMSPEEAYTTDVKYITLNLSNVEAYNPGNATSDPNFDLYLKDTATGSRYKVPVKESVILQPANDGQMGDMRITYRTGDLVDAKGVVMKDANGKEMKDLGPTLPLGEYQVEVDYKDTADTAGLYDLTTTQRFAVTENELARVKKANILAIVKSVFDLTEDYKDMKESYEEAFPGETLPAKANLEMMKNSFANAMNKMVLAGKALDPEFSGEYLLKPEEIPAYRLETFESEEELEAFKEELAEEETGVGSDEEDEGGDEVLVEIRGMINRIGSGEDAQYVVDTTSEPAVINKAVAYKGKDMVFAQGQLDVLGLSTISGAAQSPFFRTLAVKGDGILSVASSGFIFHSGEWTLDFYNGFNKSLKQSEDEDDDEEEPEDGDQDKDKKEEGGEDDSLNGSLEWATGGLSDRLNPLRQLVIEDVYFNRHSLFAAPSFSISGFGLKFNEFVLRPGGISFGGSINLKIVESEIKNVVFNDKGFVGIDANLKFDLNESIGLISSDKKGEDDPELPSGEITIVHYVQEVEDVSNTYGLKFKAELAKVGVGVELAFKQVPDKRILPDVIGFEAELGDPGVMIAGATYLQGVRGAIRELADTIAGEGNVPLTIEAGADISFGIPPATFYGSIDLTLKKTGIKIIGALDYSPSPSSERLTMITEAKIAAQWVTPWFVSASVEVDVLGWDVIIGKASLFVGQNLIKNRIDFEGFLSAKLQIPSSVPVVGGMPLAGVSLGINNDKMWGSYTLLFITLGVTYYFNGGIEFGTSGEKLPEGLAYLRIQDPESGPKLIVLGQGVETVATSWVTKEDALHEIEYHSVAKGVDLLDNGSFGIGVGGIKVSDEGRLHELPMSAVSGDALLELEYYGNTVPNLTLKDNNGQDYPLIYDVNRMNDPGANAFTQEIAGQNGTVKKIYIAVPANRAGGTWKLFSDQQVDSRILNIPVVSKLDEIRLTKPDPNPNTFTASWKVANAKPGDTVSLYLTKDAVLPPAAAGEEAAAPGSAGLLVAKDLEVTAGGALSGTTATGSTVIDVSQVSLLGAIEDIRGLLPQGDYYLRAELKSSNTFNTQTSTDKFTVVDPLAPGEVQDVTVQPAGNGYFNLSFRPSAKKPAQAGFGHSYSIEVMQEQDGALSEYDNFASLLFTEEELAPYWNAQSGKYEGIRLGGWTKASRSSKVDHSSLAGKPIEGDKFSYQGLQVGQKYVVGVSAAVRPDKAADKNENLHFSNRVDTAITLLPVPAKPVLGIGASDRVKVAESTSAYADVLTNAVQQQILLTSDQQNIEVEALYDGQSLGKVQLANNGSGSSGVLNLSTFATDGTYGIELRSTNKQTGDFSITMLYLTVDTIAPILYLDTPLTGERTSGGKIRVQGQTSNDAELRVNGQRVTVGQNGRFAGDIAVSGTDPKLDLVFEAVDRAGNRNGTTVVVTNGSYQVPVALVLRKLPNLHIADQKKVEAFLRYSNGVDKDKKPLFKEVPVPTADLDKLTYSIYAGEAASVSDSGTVKAVSEGSAIVKAEYRLTDDVALQGLTVVDVSTEVSAYTATVDKTPGVTKVNVVSAGDMTDNELVYKVYPAAAGAPVAPRYKDDVSGWSLLPAEGVVAAAAGDKVAVAKRAVGGKLAVAVSTLMAANVWSQAAPGGGGGGFGGGGNSDLKANGDTVKTEIRNDRLAARIDKAGTSAANPKQVFIEGSNALVNGYEFEIGSSLLAQAAKSGQTLRMALPFADLAIPAKLAAESGKDLKLVMEKNTASDKTGLKSIADSLQAQLLGGGEGVTFEIGQGGIYSGRSIAARVAIPDSIAAQDITGVVLKSQNGTWTTLPWALDIDNNRAYVNLTLTDDGSIAFIKNKPSFADVAADSWAKDVIAAAGGKLFMLGRGEGEFAPDSRITRAEYPTVLLRVLGLMSQQATASFTDVSQEDWFSRSVAIASANGLVNGFEDGSFRPDGDLSRLEAMVMAGRALALLGGSTSIDAAQASAILDEFTDGAVIPEWAREAVALCIREGIIDGQDQALLPDGALTRAQAAAIAARLNQKVPVGKL